MYPSPPPPCLLHCLPPAAGITEPVPAFPLVPAASVVLKLRAHEANDIFFREVCAGVAGARAGRVCLLASPPARASACAWACMLP